MDRMTLEHEAEIEDAREAHARRVYPAALAATRHADGERRYPSSDALLIAGAIFELADAVRGPARKTERFSTTPEGWELVDSGPPTPLQQVHEALKEGGIMVELWQGSAVRFREPDGPSFTMELS